MLNSPTILVCTDFSNYSDTALESAERIRQKAGGRIHVVHISEFPIDWNWMSDERDLYYMDEKLKAVIQKDIQDKLDKQIKDCRVQCTSQIISGYPFSYIHEIIKKEKADLVIIGHKGKADTLLHLGDLAQKIIASSDVPVLVTKKSMDLTKVTGLVDPHSPLDKIISASEEFSLLFSAKLGFISLWREPHLELQKGEILDKVRVIISAHVTEHLSSEVRVEFGIERKVAYQLLNLLVEDGGDMIVMQRHQKGLFEKFLIGSETRRMLELYTGNILVLPI